MPDPGPSATRSAGEDARAPRAAGSEALSAPLPAPRSPLALTSIDSSAADERVRRYQAAQTDPIVRELLKLFDADIVGRELLSREEWLKRLAGGDQR